MKDWRQYTYNTLNDLKIRAQKSKGQNFLIRYRVVDYIVESASVLPGDHILEIGGGVGILTDALAKTGANITVIEKEPKLADHLSSTFIESPQVHIQKDDALQSDWPENIRVIANLPYSISSPIIEKIVHHSVSDATIMLQREVGLRCIAKPGTDNYSRLTVLCNIHGKTSRVMDVAPESFFPTPKVSSIVIHFTKIEPKWINSHEELEQLTLNLFTVRRRTVRKVIRRFLRRKEVPEEAWEDCPSKEKRIFHLSVSEIDSILSHLKEHQAWPLA